MIKKSPKTERLSVAISADTKRMIDEIAMSAGIGTCTYVRTLIVREIASLEERKSVVK